MWLMPESGELGLSRETVDDSRLWREEREVTEPTASPGSAYLGSFSGARLSLCLFLEKMDRPPEDCLDLSADDMMAAMRWRGETLQGGEVVAQGRSHDGGTICRSRGGLCVTVLLHNGQRLAYSDATIEVEEGTDSPGCMGVRRRMTYGRGRESQSQSNLSTGRPGARSKFYRQGPESEPFGADLTEDSAVMICCAMRTAGAGLGEDRPDREPFFRPAERSRLVSRAGSVSTRRRGVVGRLVVVGSWAKARRR